MEETKNTPKEIRKLISTQEFQNNTSGICPGYIQAK
jgi:uncharacterized protein YcsI (UPF0317 family)